jgi:hypothetical protein
MQQSGEKTKKNLSDSKRYSTVVIGNKKRGIYVSSNPSSDSKKQNQKKYPFELRFNLTKSIIPLDLIKKYGKKLEEDLGKTLYDYGEKWKRNESAEDVEDVSKLPKKIKDFLTKDLLNFEMYSSNPLTYKKVIYGKGNNYISVIGYADFPLKYRMPAGNSLASSVDIINQKSIWQHFHKIYPIYKNQLYDFVFVSLYDENGKAVEEGLFNN